MNNYWNCLLAALILLVYSSHSFAADCDQRKGAKLLEGRSFDAAFVALRACENHPDVSPQTLRNLAKLYGSMDHAELTEIETEKKVWHLIHRAAALGDERSLFALIRLYTHGDEALRVRANSEIRQCLENISRVKNVDAGERVTDCFVRR